MMGYAFPVRVEAVFKAPDVPYVGLLKALDAVGKDQVYVTPSNRNNGGNHPAAFWGELLSTACKHKGVAGALTDGQFEIPLECKHLVLKFLVYKHPL